MSSKWNIDTKAAALGFLTDTACSIALSVLLVTAMSGAGIKQSDIMSRMQTASGLLLSLIMGLSCTVFGGYVAGRVAKRDEIKHGVVVAVLGLILGIILRETDLPLWYELVGYLCIIPAGILGGYLAAGRNKRTAKGSET